MASISSFFNNFISLFILLLHLGCFIFPSKHQHHHHKPPPKKRKLSTFSPLSLSSSSWSYLKRIFSCKSNTTSSQTHQSTISARSSSHQSILPLIPPAPATESPLSADHPHSRRQESDISAGNPFFPLRNDIFPCPICGEIFHKPANLEQHQSIHHAVSELIDGDSSKNIIKIIFKTGWNNDPNKNPNPIIHQILKIHNSQKILSRFEEYRETVKAKAARNGGAQRRRFERCIADGNELLRFHCTTFLCELGRNGNSSICNQQYCSTCGIIRSGFSPKMDGISTLSSSWRAHVAIPDEIEKEFAFMNVKRAMLVCRVVAGRVGCGPDEEDLGKEDGGCGFDSIVGRSGSGANIRLDEDELLVFNPRAVLPCFVIVYTV